MLGYPKKINVSAASGRMTFDVECPDGPEGNNKLTVPMVTSMIHVRNPSRFEGVDGAGMVPIRMVPVKSARDCTIAGRQGSTLDEIEVMGKDANHPGVLLVGLTRGQRIERIKLSRMTRGELEKKLKPTPKVLVLLAAMGRNVPVQRLRAAIDEIVESEARWVRYRATANSASAGAAAP